MSLSNINKSVRRGHLCH